MKGVEEIDIELARLRFETAVDVLWILELQLQEPRQKKFPMKN